MLYDAQQRASPPPFPSQPSAEDEDMLSYEEEQASPPSVEEEDADMVADEEEQAPAPPRAPVIEVFDMLSYC